MPGMARLIFMAVLTVILAFYFRSALSSETQLPLSSLQGYPKESNAYSSFTRKIVAVGDLHGDLPNALKVLKMAHVVDARGNWSGMIDFFVQTGDIVDR
jgi:hypothetical protein